MFRSWNIDNAVLHERASNITTTTDFVACSLDKIERTGEIICVQLWNLLFESFVIQVNVRIFHNCNFLIDEFEVYTQVVYININK